MFSLFKKLFSPQSHYNDQGTVTGYVEEEKPAPETSQPNSHNAQGKVSSSAKKAGAQGTLEKTDATTTFNEYDEQGRVIATTETERTSTAPDLLTDVVTHDMEYNSFGQVESEQTLDRTPGRIKVLLVAGLLVALPLLGGFIYNQFGRQRATIQESNSRVLPAPQRDTVAELILPPTPTPTSTPQPTATPTPTAFAQSQAPLPANLPACVPAPVLFDPSDGKSFAARNMVFRWRSDYALKPGEEFEILVSPDGAPAMTRLGATSEKTLALDLTRWQYAGWFTKFNVLVRIKDADARYLDCAGKPVSFVLNDPTVGEQPTSSGQPQQSGQPPQPPPRR